MQQIWNPCYIDNAVVKTAKTVWSVDTRVCNGATDFAGPK